MRNCKTAKRNRRPLRKLIALWVVFAMLVVPFVGYLGEKEGAKAEGEESNVQIIEDAQTYTETIGLTITKSDGATDIDSHNDTDHSKTIVLLKKAQKLEIKIGSVSAPEGVTVSKYGYMEYETSATIDTTVTTDATVTEMTDGKATIAEKEASKKYAIYAKADSVYQLQYVLQVTRVDAFGSGDGIYAGENSENAFSDGAYTASAYLKAQSADTSSIATASLKYYVGTADLSDDTAKKSAATYVQSSNLFGNTDSKLCNQTVYAYAAIISNNNTEDLNDDIVLAYEKLGYVYISNDVTAPSITCDKIEYYDSQKSLYSSIEETYTDSTNNTYYGVSEKYKYTLTIKDEVASGEGVSEVASGIETVTAKFIDNNGNNSDSVAITSTGSDNKYTIELEKANAGKTIQVIATDKMGHEKTLDLMKIVQVEESTKVESVKILADDTWDNWGNTAKYIKEQKTLEVKVSSTKSIADVQLANNTVTLTKNDSFSVTSNVDRTSTATAQFTVPADLTNSITLSGLKVQIKETESSSFSDVTDGSIADIIYDKDIPTITSIKIQKSNNNGTSWTDIDGTGDAIITELNYKYRYVVSASDTNLDGVSYNDGSTTGEITYDTTATAYLLDVPENKLSSSTPYTVTVTARDKAGNESASQTFRGILKLDDSFKIENLRITDASGTDVTDALDAFASGKTYYTKYPKEQYTLSVTVSSAYSITDVKLYSDKSPDGQAPTTPISVSQDSDTHRYSTTASFTLLDTQNDLNEALNSMYIQATNADTNTAYNTVRYPEDKALYIGNILYDRTPPTLSISNTTDTAWHKEYSLNYTIQSGNPSEPQSVESPLKNGTVKYTLSDCKNNVADGQIAVDGTQTSVSSSQALIIPQSTSTAGTLLTFAAQDMCENNLPVTSYRIKVDNEAPQISLFDVNGKTILSNALEGNVVIRANVSDNLTIASATIQVVGPDTDVTKTLCDAGEQAGIGRNNSFTLNDLIGRQAADGDYTVTVRASDMAGNAAPDRTISFTVDNTIPVVTAKITGGTTAGKQPGTNFDGTPCDYYYSSNVAVLLTYEDDNLPADGVTVTDNGNRLNLKWTRVGTGNLYQTVYTATQEGPHTVRISATDDAGNNAAAKQVVFIRDTIAPTVSAVLNGGIVYSEGMGVVDLTSAASLHLSVSDANEDAADFNYQLVKTLPDALPVTADYIRTDNRTFGYTDEADYEVNVYAVDRAGNRGPARSVKFRVDTTAPELKISGAASGAALSSGTTLTFTMTEAFWRDASGRITITRKAGDGAAEATYKTIDFKPTGRTTNMTEALTETGEYKVTFVASDRAGHKSETAAYTVKIDKDKPVITLNGVSNNDKTTGEVEFMAQIEEDFYLTKAISIKATRTYLDETTNQEKTEDIRFTGYNAAASATIIRNTFQEDGIYKIQITCRDAAGNEDVQEVSFTIDKSSPIVDAKVLAAYEGTLTAFTWDYDIYDLVYDLTVCDVHMYLNGSEYDGVSEIEDGVYEMKITAEDELGNYEEQIVSFTLDTKAPTFIVTGVEDGEVKNEQYSIEVSLQLDEDMLDSVSLNGSPVAVENNRAVLTVSDKGDYTLTMAAHDAAGNEAEKTITFTYGEKKQIWLYIVIGVAGLAVVGGVAFVIVRKRK